MPIKLPSTLPAYDVLSREGVMVMDEAAASAVSDVLRTGLQACVALDAGSTETMRWLPTTCAYRRLAEGKPLEWWHPLVSGDPQSVHFFHDVGLDYVSCSPFRVPVARLEAARASLGMTSSDMR